MKVKTDFNIIQGYFTDGADKLWDKTTIYRPCFASQYADLWSALSVVCSLKISNEIFMTENRMFYIKQYFFLHEDRQYE